MGTTPKIMLRRGQQRSERGASLIEFAMSFAVVIFLIFWMFEMIMVMYTYSTLTDAAKEGVRYAIVHGSNNPTTVTAVKDRVQTFANLSLHDLSGMTVDVEYFKADGTQYTDAGGAPLTSTGAVTPPDRVSVTVAYPFIPYIHLPWTAPTIHATAQGRVAN